MHSDMTLWRDASLMLTVCSLPVQTSYKHLADNTDESINYIEGLGREIMTAKAT